MSAADRMVVRTRSGAYRSLPRRTALGLIAAGRVTLEPAPVTLEPAPVTLEPAPVTLEPAPVTPEPAPVTAVVPPSPDSAPTTHHRPRTIQFQPDGPKVRADGTNEPADVINDLATELGADVSHVPPAELQYVSDSLDADVPTVEAVPLPPEPKPTARRGEWADYAGSLGVEVTSNMTKREIQQAAEEAATSLTNLPQPALTGGRLETPEDEPATETVADDQDPRTR